MRATRRGVLAAATLLAARPAGAQSFPDRPVTLMVGYGAGVPAGAARPCQEASSTPG